MSAMVNCDNITQNEFRESKRKPLQNIDFITSLVNDGKICESIGETMIEQLSYGMGHSRKPVVLCIL
jgi:hypothetical protein